jgi:hypothetical protein
MQVIFGRDFKLEAADPYLFYAFEFRRCTFDARVIVSIGYGFGDEHINKMLSQSLRADTQKRLLVIRNVRDDDAARPCEDLIKGRLGIEAPVIVVLTGTAKDFLKRTDIADEVTRHLPEESKTEF